MAFPAPLAQGQTHLGDAKTSGLRLTWLSWEGEAKSGVLELISMVSVGLNHALGLSHYL